LAVFGLTLGLSACFHQAPSIHPLFTDTISVPVEGLWAGADGHRNDDGDTLTFTRRDDHYEVEYHNDCGKDDCTMKFDVRFGRLSGRLFADFTGGQGDKDALGSWPVHAFARVELTKDQLEFSTLQRDWLRTALDQKLLTLRHESEDGEVVLTAPTRDLQRFVTEWANHPDAFGSRSTFSRVPAEPAVPAPAAP
jgi:hypothetical protein